DSAGVALDSSATVSALAVQDQTIYVAGNFSSSGFESIFSISDKANDLGEGGLNGGVSSMALNDSALFVGGSFTGTQQGNTKGLSGVASYNISTGKWVPLGAGVNGQANYVVPFGLNLTAATNPELAVAVSGNFDKVLGC